MAIQKNIALEDNFGKQIDFPSAYIKVEAVSSTKTSATASVRFYEVKEGQLLTEKGFVFNPNLEGDNFIAQAYEHLKTLTEFADAVDC